MQWGFNTFERKYLWKYGAYELHWQECDILFKGTKHIMQYEITIEKKLFEVWKRVLDYREWLIWSRTSFTSCYRPIQKPMYYCILVILSERMSENLGFMEFLFRNFCLCL